MRARERGTAGDGNVVGTIQDVSKAKHIEDHHITYYIAGTVRGSGGTRIDGVSAGNGFLPDAQPSRFPFPPVPPGIVYVPNAELLIPGNYSSAAAAWQNILMNPGRITFQQINNDNTLNSLPVTDVLIIGYWDPNNIDYSDDCHSVGTVACVFPPGTHPETSSNQMALLVEEPPHWPGRDNHPEVWTTNFAESQADPQTYEYLPGVLMHEFGHVIQLEHSGPSTSAVMKDVGRLTLSSYDIAGAMGLYGHLVASH